ncbi:DUF262 domain-containing protein [Bacteroides sp. KH569_7]|uniref:DUF262 domain-containing protein n=1 Tax=Bacteroides muris (ex Fokt et al. 2023) TaxID=2937417 RepID=A0A9X2NVP3_9BACE|nr:DUF262 domain-containing protein [Bacteroides muris (ex Fokt et al. 2023)]MCR6506885.1 DUF262 domain-containing protein [Bacteroides muris (ex Fokt et al. 2023)]
MRKQNFQTVSWFNDIYRRDLLNLSPSYQRRSVWSQEYKDFFIDTILLNYPAPALFLFEEIDTNGVAKYNVVDGKQRLTTIFDFVDNKFPISEKATNKNLRGKYFDDLNNDIKINIWNYSFIVEYIPSENESIINDIFDRINRNTAKLSAQELRHAKYSGAFITTSENMTDLFYSELRDNVPRITSQARKQMKDVEFVAQLLLLIEEGPKGYSQEEIDVAFNDRDEEWVNETYVVELFKRAINVIKEIWANDESGKMKGSRLMNQADFYSLFGAIILNLKEGKIYLAPAYYDKLMDFMDKVNDEEYRSNNPSFENYYQNARAASNRTSARKDRIQILQDYLNTNL